MSGKGRNVVIDRDLGYRAFRDLVRDSLGDVGVYVGIRADRGAEVIAGEVTLAAIGTVHEFGSADGRIPQRSYLRSTVDERRREYAKALRAAADAALVEVVRSRRVNLDAVRRKFERVGAFAVGDVKRKITDLRTPPNAPSTIRRKGSDNPLIDTGRLRASIDFEVRLGKAAR